MEGLTELDLRHTALEKEGAAAVVVALAGCGLLARLTISGEEGKQTGWIEKAACSGSSFAVGAIVQYEGRPCRVTTGVDSYDKRKVRACGAVVAMEAGMTELDVSGKGLGAAGAAVVAGFLPRCTALVSANLLCNGIGTEQAAVLAEVVKEHGTLVSVCGLRGSDTAVDMSGKRLRAEDVVLLAGELELMEGLKVLNLSQNEIKGTEAGEALARALASNAVLEELHLSGNDCGAELITGMSPGVAKNKTLVKLDITANTYDDAAKTVLAEALAQSRVRLLYCDQWLFSDDGTEFTLHADTCSEVDKRLVAIVLSRCDLVKVTVNRGGSAAVAMEAGMTELDVSGKGLGAAGAAVVASFLPRCTALVSANLLCNGIGTEQAAVLVEVVKQHGTLESVCGLRVSDTAVDMSGKGLGAEDVVLLAGELESMEGLTELDLSGNTLVPFTTALASGWMSKESDYMPPWVHTDGRIQNKKPLEPPDVTGLVALCHAIECIRALTELDLSSTGLGPAGAAVVAGFLPRCTALVSANLLCNVIGTEQAAVLVEVVKEHGTLASVCGVRESDTGAPSFAIMFDDDDVNDAVPEQYITKQSGNDPIQIGDKVTITWATHYEGETHPAVITAVNAAVDMSGKGLRDEDVVLLAGELESIEDISAVEPAELLTFTLSKSNPLQSKATLKIKNTSGGRIAFKVPISSAESNSISFTKFRLSGQKHNAKAISRTP
jgi:hypothetical protein